MGYGSASQAGRPAILPAPGRLSLGPARVAGGRQGLFPLAALERWIGAADCCPWAASCGRTPAARAGAPRPLYTPDQRRRRDASKWTTVQALLAPTQFLICLISVALVLHYLATGAGYGAATASILVKTAALGTIMVTGSLWERDIFGQYLFAPAFFWEDVFSLLVIALHLAYVAALLGGVAAPQQMLIALSAYAAYIVNATQFVLKMRAARQGAADAR